MTEPNSANEPRLVADARAEVGEGPLFASDGSLLWVDILGRKVFRYDPSTESNDVLFEHPTQNVAFVLEAADATPIVGLEKTVHAFSNGELNPDPLLTVVEASRRMAMNDATVDPLGTLWVGVYEEHRASGEGELWRVSPTGEARLAISGLTLPNGIAFSPEGNRMYLADSFEYSIYSYGIDLESGDLRDKRTIWNDETAGLPDGLCTDVDGNVWVAFWGGSDVRVFNPDGRQIARIELPVTQVSSCAFGPGTDLYITTARAFIEESDLRDQPSAGGLFAAQVGIQGIPVEQFGAVAT